MSAGSLTNQLAATALAEKMAALMTQEYLEERARRGDRRNFERALAKISPTHEPEPQDQR